VTLENIREFFTTINGNYNCTRVKVVLILIVILGHKICNLELGLEASHCHFYFVCNLILMILGRYKSQCKREIEIDNFSILLFMLSPNFKIKG